MERGGAAVAVDRRRARSLAGALLLRDLGLRGLVGRGLLLRRLLPRLLRDLGLRRLRLGLLLRRPAARLGLLLRRGLLRRLLGGGGRAVRGGSGRGAAAAPVRFSRGPSVALPRCTAEPGPISIWWIR